ncbi:hypothetical protein [Falsirhodobacter sp. alg1]|nr:hypothetical protein [Falsirhodobacter sp. alg1]
MLSRPDHQYRAEGECPDRMSVPYICLIAVVAVLAGVVLAWIG